MVIIVSPQWILHDLLPGGFLRREEISKARSQVCVQKFSNSSYYLHMMRITVFKYRIVTRRARVALLSNGTSLQNNKCYNSSIPLCLAFVAFWSRVLVIELD